MYRKKLPILLLLVLMLNIIVPPIAVFSDEINGSDVPTTSSSHSEKQSKESESTSDSSSSAIPSESQSDVTNTGNTTADEASGAAPSTVAPSSLSGEKAITSRVTYNANEGTNSGVLKNDEILLHASYTVGSIGTGLGELNFTAPDPTKQVFNGWNTDPNGSGESYSAGQTVATWPYSSDIILYAQWAGASTVTYNLNGATGQNPPVKQFDKVGSQVVVANIPENLNFQGNKISAGVWNSKSDGTGTDYKPGDLYTLTDANLSLYLKIVDKPADNNAKLTFDLNGGSTTDSALNDGVKTNPDNDYKVSLPSAKPTRDNYIFKGWTINGQTYQPSDEVKVIYTTTAKAIWTPIQKIYFENGLPSGTTDIVTGMPSDTSVEANGGQYKLPADVPTRSVTDSSGITYKFLYWKRTSDSINFYPEGQVRTNTSVSEWHFVAVWESFNSESQWTITFNNNGATGGSAPYAYTYVDKGKSFKVPGRGTLTKKGASFVGWADDNTTYDEGDLFTPTENTTLTAVWSQDETQGTVKFVTQSKTGHNPPSQTGETGENGTVITLPNVPENNTPPQEGYVFWGWAKSKNASVPDYYAGKKYKLSKGITTLYGVWTGVLTEYWTQIKVNVNGADGKLPDGISSNNFYALNSEDETYSFKVPDITRTGYNLMGWEYSKDSKIYQVNDSITLKNIATSKDPGTLTAKWEPIKYKISYDKGDATSGTVPTENTIEVGYNTAYTILNNSGNLAKKDHTFIGWTDGTDTYTPGQNMLPTADVVLKPVWKVNPTVPGGNTHYVKIMYIALEGDVTGDLPDSVSVPGDYTTSYTVAEPKANFSYPGYEFKGWYLLDKKGNQVGYSPGSTFVVGNDDLIFYAKWVKKQVVPNNTFVVSFNGNGNTSGFVPDDLYVKSGNAAQLPGNNSLVNKQFKDNNTSTGEINTNDYIFVGWSKNKDATADDADVFPKGTSISPTTDEVYYAIWDLEKKDITLTFNGNGNTGGTLPPNITRMRYTEDKVDASNIGATLTKSVVVSGEVVTYYFGGWNTKEDGKGVDYYYGSIFNFPKNTTLYAKWIPTKSVAKSRIIYLGNGNTSGDNIRYDDTNSASYTIKDAGNMRKAGYMFVGWNTRSDGTGTSYNVGSSIVTANYPSLTLYAQWLKVESGMNIVYNGNGNTSGKLPDPFNGPKGTEVTLASVSDVASLGLKKTGYMFAGWSKTPTGLGTQLVAGKTYTFNEDTILYAIWAEDGSYVATPSTITYHPNYMNATGTYDVSGYVNPLLPVDNINILHGHKEVKNEINGGAYLGEDYALVAFATTGLTGKKNYAFSGWSTDPLAETPMYTSQQVINLKTTHLDLYAVWTPGNYQIQFDKNATDATETMENQTVDYDETQNLNINQFKRPGYSFVGWNTKSDGSGISYTNEQSILNLANADETITLFAQWVKTEYHSISFDLNAGSDPTAMTDQKSITHLEIGTNYSFGNTIKTASRAGYEFTGWYTSATGTDKMPESVVIANQDITYYAHWKVNAYEVLFDKNASDATGDMKNQAFTYDIAQTLTANAFNRSGYHFKGWNTKSDGTGTNYTNQQSVMNLTTASGGKVTLYAQWESETGLVKESEDILPKTGEAVSNDIAILGVIVLASLAIGYIGFKRNRKHHNN